MIETAFFARQERLGLVESTNDVVRGWLAAGVPEVCLAVADEQSAGRGREGRTWVAPAGRALLISLGFRPTWLAPDRVWQLAGAVSLAMAEAAEEVAGLPTGTIRLKWPNDLVVEMDGLVRKVAGVLGETDGLGGEDPRAVVGIGINADWPATEFPSGLAGSMTSLREAAGGRSIDRDRLLLAFADRLEQRIDAVRTGGFDGASWTDRQLTDGRLVDLIGPDGVSTSVRALRADPLSGALIVEDRTAPGVEGTERAIVSGEIRHLRLSGDV